MADPIVHITAGIPDGGTGNITTLGQTLLDGANATLGAQADVAVTAGAAGTIAAKLRAISRDIAGGIILQGGGNTIGAVTQAGNWSVRNLDGSGAALTSVLRGSQQALSVQLVDGSGNQITAFGGGTSSSFGSAFPATGTAAGAQYQSIAPTLTSGNMASMQLDINGNLKTVIQNASVTINGTVTSNQGTGGGSAWLVTGAGGTFPVTGTFWQATQPVSIAATVNVNATQNGTWTVQPGNTANTTAWLVTGAGGTFPITAASLPLPAGAATAANQASAAGQASATSGQTGTLAMGAATSAAPSYTTNQTNPLSLTLAGALRVDGSAVTQPISGSVNQGGNWNVRLQDGSGNAITSDTRGTERPLSVQILDASGNQITAFGGSGGTASNFGSVFPSSGTAAGGEYLSSPPTITSGNMCALQCDVNGNLKTNIINASIAVTGTFWQATQPVSIASAVTVQQATAANLNATVTGTVAATQSGNWTSRIVGNAGSTLDTVASNNAAMPANMLVIGGQYNTSPGSITTGSAGVLQLNSTGSVKVDGSGVTQPVSGTFWQATQPVSGTVTANQGGTWNITNISGTISLPTGAATSANQPTAAALASTTAGQTGNLDLGAVTTSAPSYTTGTSNALSLNTSGGLRVDGSGVTQPVSGTFWQATQPVSGTVTANQGGTWTVQPGNTANTTAWLVTGSGGTFPATQSGTWNITNISGTISLPTGAATSANQPTNASQGSTTSGQTGNLMMGAVTTGSPTYVTAQTSPLSLDTTGALRVNVTAGSGGGGTASSFGTTFPATGTAAGGEYLSSPPTITSGQMCALQCDVNGNLKTNIVNASIAVTGTFWQATQPISAASLPLPSGAATAANQTNVQGVIGAATAPASMIVEGGVFNTTKPTLTTGQSAAIQLNSAGSQLVDGSAVTQPVSGTFWQTTQPVSIAATVNVSAAQSGNWSVRNLGNAGAILDGTMAAATAPANGFGVLGQYLSAPPTLTSGQSQGLRLTSAGALVTDGSAATQPVQGVGSFIVTQGTAANLNATAVCAGDVAQGATNSGNPIQMGGVAHTATPTAVSDGQRMAVSLDKVGKVLTAGAIRTNKGRNLSTLTTNSASAIVVGTSGIFNDLYGLIITNNQSTACTVTIADGATNIMIIEAPANDTRGFMLPVDSAIPQAAVNTSWTGTLSVASGNVSVTALYVANT